MRLVMYMYGCWLSHPVCVFIVPRLHLIKGQRPDMCSFIHRCRCHVCFHPTLCIAMVSASYILLKVLCFQCTRVDLFRRYTYSRRVNHCFETCCTFTPTKGDWIQTLIVFGTYVFCLPACMNRCIQLIRADKYTKTMYTINIHVYPST